MLQQLFAPQLVILYILVASTLYVHSAAASGFGSRASSAITRPTSRPTMC